MGSEVTLILIPSSEKWALLVLLGIPCLWEGVGGGLSAQGVG